MQAVQKNYQRILVAIDFAGQAEAVLTRALRVARAEGAILKLVHCVPSIDDTYTAAYGLADTVVLADMQELMREALDKSDARLADMLGAVAGLECSFESLSGATVDSIVAESERFQADLIVLGSHGQQGLRWLLGSVASGVLHRAACDTLMVRL